MQNITIDRYPADHAKNLETGKGFAGHIAGTDDNGRHWIMWLDETGRPVVFFGNREASGAVLEPRVDLVESAAEQVCGD
jgi:hypothetical protein